MALNVALLRDSFALVSEREPELTLRFYDILFRRFPAAQPLFRRNARAEQATMLRQALVAVLEHLEDGAWLTETLGAMGKKHVEYGVTDEMYDWVGASLLEAIAVAAGDAFTPELQAAWGDAYAAIAGLMKAGAKA